MVDPIEPQVIPTKPDAPRRRLLRPARLGCLGLPAGVALTVVVLLGVWWLVPPGGWLHPS